MNYDRVVQRSLEKSDYSTAVDYLNNVLSGGGEASDKHAELKIQCLLKEARLKEALDFAKWVTE